MEIEGPLNLEVPVPQHTRTVVNLMFDDGTHLYAEYNPRHDPTHEAMWSVRPLRRGSLYEEHINAEGPDGDYSDRVTLAEGIRKVVVSYPGYTHHFYAKENA